LGQYPTQDIALEAAMIVVTSMMTGLFAAMLRSAFGVIVVAFLIGIVFAIAFVLYGTSLASLVLAVLGFNGGLLLLGAAHVVGSGTRSAS